LVCLKTNIPLDLSLSRQLALQPPHPLNLPIRLKNNPNQCVAFPSRPRLEHSLWTCLALRRGISGDSVLLSVVLRNGARSDRLGPL
jgi:hypothetical protein